MSKKAARTPSPRPRRRREYAEEDPEMQIAPLVDLMLTILIFFMVTTTTDVLQTKRDVKLPVADASKTKIKAEQGETVVNVRSTAFGYQLYDGEVPLPSPEALTAVLQPRSDLARNPDGSSRWTVRLRADRNIRYEHIREIMVACANAGISRVKYAVATREEQTR